MTAGILVSTCAHCGSESAMREGSSPEGHGSSIDWLELHCTQCPSRMRITEYEARTRDERLMMAVMHWNRRPA